ncbi:hypothetical protein I7I51_07956 [Histoplasma capsulatum]|uniref:Uncharacterized protein n=1 Tax=Ajellomyces capsulatus TaxID=5037 RepID=A0A8A1LX95_AJECA|nr:hypothetical protein I7I51_07956 [Histoplasma capsulatum]
MVDGAMTSSGCNFIFIPVAFHPVQHSAAMFSSLHIEFIMPATSPVVNLLVGTSLLNFAWLYGQYTHLGLGWLFSAPNCAVYPLPAPPLGAGSSLCVDVQAKIFSIRWPKFSTEKGYFSSQAISELLLPLASTLKYLSPDLTWVLRQLMFSLLRRGLDS